MSAHCQLVQPVLLQNRTFRVSWPYLTNYLKDGRLELSNNRAERSIKPFVIDRKNYLFANTPGRAKGSAVIFTKIQTAIENHLDPYRYLTWLLKAANTADLTRPEVIEQLLPWNAPQECRTNWCTYAVDGTPTYGVVLYDDRFDGYPESPLPVESAGIHPGFLGKLWLNWQELAARDFVSRQGMESEGILCVFLTFHTAAWEQKIRCPAADDLFRVSLVRHPFKSPFAPISQIAEGQIFKIWEYYLILGEVGSYWERLGRRGVVERLRRCAATHRWCVFRGLGILIFLTMQSSWSLLSK